MKKKGFTLIELLAVIVILAIIAVITVPKIADMISSSRQGGAEDSFYGTLKAAELGYTKALQSNTNLKGSTCNIVDSKITCTNGVKIDVSGKNPESGTLVIDSAGSTIAKALTLNGYKCYGDLSTENPCVKAAVDVASETLIKKMTTSGDGLYKDSYEEERYIFKGTTPNNYITFNNEVAGWRIVAIETDGTLKIMRNSSIGNMFWNTEAKNVWANSTLNTYLNKEYFKSLNSASKLLIQNHSYGVGTFTYGNTNLKEQIDKENSTTWNGNIALISASDYLRANSDTEKCGNSKLNTDNRTVCATTNWMIDAASTAENYWSWLISPSATKDGFASHICGSTNNANVYYEYRGQLSTEGVDKGAGHGGTFIGDGVIPVLYLKSNIQLTGGGTSSDPYKILS